MEPRSRHRLLILVLLATFVAWLPALWNGYAQDDCYIVQVAGNQHRPNAMVAEWQGVTAYFGQHYGASIYASGSGYRPITVMSYAATYAVFGDHVFGEAFPHHFVNVLLHVLGAFLTWRLLRELRCGDAASLLGALVFGLHAIRVEAVAGIVGRAELLAFVAGAAALLLWHRRLQRGPGAKGRNGAFVASAVLLFVAFASKESALAWVPFLPVFAFAAGGSLRRSTVAAVACAAIPLVLFLGLRAHALAGLPEGPPIHYSANPLAGESWGVRVGTALFLAVHGLWKTLLPLSLCSDYGAHTFALATGLGDPRALGALALIVVLVGAGCAVARRQPLVFLAMASFFGFSFITSNVPFATGTIFAERLYYTPALAVTFLAAGAVDRWPRWAWVAVLAWLVPSVVVLETRIPVWRDDTTLFATDVKVNPRSLRLLAAWSDTLRGRGPEHLDEAIVPLRQALALEPELATAWFSLAALLVKQSQRQTAAAPARELLIEAEAALHRGHAAKLANPDSEKWRCESVLGGVCLRLGKLDEAERWLHAALARNPRYQPAWVDVGQLGEAWIAAGRPERARAVFMAMAGNPAVSPELQQGASLRLQQLR